MQEEANKVLVIIQLADDDRGHGDVVVVHTYLVSPFIVVAVGAVTANLQSPIQIFAKVNNIGKRFMLAIYSSTSLPSPSTSSPTIYPMVVRRPRRTLWATLFHMEL